MAMRFIIVSAVLAVVLPRPVDTNEPTIFGAGVSLTEVTPIARVLQDPASFEGQTVRVEGTVAAVCRHMGCWMSLAPTEAATGSPRIAPESTVSVPAARTLRLKVDDGVIVFPVSAKGRRAAAQGVIQRVTSGDAEGNEAAGEHARAEGAAPRTASTWHLKVTGAVVY
jgi:hypothetical protein